jgi:hypothetical protein
LWGSQIYDFFIAVNKIEAISMYFHDVPEIQEKSCPSKTIPKVRSSGASSSGRNARPIA